MVDAQRIHRNKLRRLRLLQFLYQAFPAALTDRMLLQLAKEDPELDPDIKMVRRSIFYLQKSNFAEVEVSGEVWVVNITPKGIDYLEGKDPDIKGIYHPDQFMG
jgi:hypothetical protein